ncbi:hypothetical protein FOZ62_024349 [Perkinsus olseni]|uniref:Uncharacterized protein n=1 Tax=Perkinsus olseni TaxID=32597 RepID=A0A7J6TTU8_PEROL|nr:hypothetical protein FOZ62_024349 [Perkinsus olseni]
MLKSNDETAVPVLDLFIKRDTDRSVAVQRADDASARNLARWLTDFDYMNTFDDAWQLVDSMLATGQDLGSVARHLENRQNEKKSVTAATVPKAQKPARGEKRTASEMEKENDASAIQPHVKTSGKVSATSRKDGHEYHIERNVKSEKEAVDTMRVADHIMSRALEQEQDSSRAWKDIADEMKMVDDDETARDFADMLDDFGFVESHDAARELVGSLMATQQNLSRVADHFMRHARTNSLKGAKKVADAQKKAVGDAAGKNKTDGQAQQQEQKTA